MKLKFNFEAVASPTEPKTTVIALTSLTTVHGKTYAIPEDVAYMDHHDKLKNTEVFKKIKKSFERRGEKISIWIKLSKEVEEIYTDEDENLQFNGKFLKEIQREEQTELTRILEKLIDKSEKKEEEVNLKHVVDKFVLEKFQSKKK